MIQDLQSIALLQHVQNIRQWDIIYKIQRKNTHTLSTACHYAVLTMSSGPPPKTSETFVWTNKFFSFYLELYKTKFKNLIWTNKFKFSFLGLFKYDNHYN